LRGTHICVPYNPGIWVPCGGIILQGTGMPVPYGGRKNEN